MVRTNKSDQGGSGGLLPKGCSGSNFELTTFRSKRVDVEPERDDFHWEDHLSPPHLVPVDVRGEVKLAEKIAKNVKHMDIASSLGLVLKDLTTNILNQNI